MRKALLAIAASAIVSLALGAEGAQAATVLDVEWNGAACGKATCFDDKGRYTQTFAAAAFQGPVTIARLLMDRGVLGILDGETFRISFQLNGEELGTWGKYNMGGIGGEQLSFGGQNFMWNPQDGDLVLVLELVPPPTAGAGGGFFRAASPPPEGDEGSLDEGDGNPLLPPDDGRQVPPDTSTPQAAPVPEPSAWALMIGGFGLAGAVFRRRRAVLPVQPLR